MVLLIQLGLEGGFDGRGELSAEFEGVGGDGDQIGQVLANLIINAQHAMTDWPGLRCLTIAPAVDRDGGAVQVIPAVAGGGR